MLHLSLLPDHARWADFFFRLSTRGGGRGARVPRRLRLARGDGPAPAPTAGRALRRRSALVPRRSATVGNPGELAKRLTGLEVDEIVDDASPRGEKLFALWNPPIVDEETGQRRSALSEACVDDGSLVDDGVRTIGFTRVAARRRAARGVRAAGGGRRPASRRASGRTAPATWPRTGGRSNGSSPTASSWRWPPRTRSSWGSTSARSTRPCWSGYPGTRASMWQQAGRAGRARRRRARGAVAQDDPLDQYLVHHPEDLFDRPAEAAVIDPTNPYVMEPHLRCAARELPLRDAEPGVLRHPRRSPRSSG